MDKKKLETVVREVLNDSPETRNDDKQLTVRVWWRLSPYDFMQNRDGEWMVKVEAIKTHLPSQDSIKRVRAKIQNGDREFLPTDPTVLRHRQATKRDAGGKQAWEDKYTTND